MRWVSRWVGPATASLVLAACTGSAGPGLWTNDAVVSQEFCAGPLVIDDLQGTIVIDPQHDPVVTLRLASGQEVDLRWPHGFHLVDGRIIDTRGNLIAGDGDSIEFPGVSIRSAVGTRGDPYQVQGTVGQYRCYVPVP